VVPASWASGAAHGNRHGPPAKLDIDKIAGPVVTCQRQDRVQREEGHMAVLPRTRAGVSAVPAPRRNAKMLEYAAEPGLIAVLGAT
jgi:hypothetical protein